MKMPNLSSQRGKREYAAPYGAWSFISRPHYNYTVPTALTVDPICQRFRFLAHGFNHTTEELFLDNS
jgi:hypothetical protein